MHFQKPLLGTPLDFGNPLNKDLAMHLACNEGNGDKVQDLSLNGNHGTLNNFAYPPTVTSGWNPGQTGIGLNSDGENDYIDCGTNPNCQLNGVTTVSALVKSPNTVNQPIISWRSGQTVPSLYINLTTNKPIMFLGGSNYRYFDCNVIDNEWHNLVFVMFGTANADILKAQLYVDGEEIAADATSSAGAVDSSDTTIIGKTGTHNVIGSIDQVRIHHRIPTAKEVKDYAINPWQVYLDEGGM